MTADAVLARPSEARICPSSSNCPTDGTTTPRRPQPAAVTLARLLDDHAGALDGYPVRPLVNDWLDALRSSADGGEAGQVLRFVLRHWAGQLDHNLAELHAGTGDAVGQVRQQVHDTRRALATLMAELPPLPTAATGAAPDQAPAGPATNPCRMLAR